MKYPQNELQQHAKPVHASTKKLIDALFGFQYSAEIIAVILVFLSILLATFFIHDGLFPTAQHTKMSNYHRWLYDQFVIVSGVIVLAVYFRLKHKMSEAQFRQCWRSYIQANAKFKLYRYLKAQEKGKLPFLHSKTSEYIVILCFILGFIAFYAYLTPSESTRRGDFMILTWWPINAVIIGVCYYGQIWFAIRLMSVSEISIQYFALIQKEHALR